jgi:hypothetical protein
VRGAKRLLRESEESHEVEAVTCLVGAGTIAADGLAPKLVRVLGVVQRRNYEYCRGDETERKLEVNQG